jgi:hypothetical protein
MEPPYYEDIFYTISGIIARVFLWPVLTGGEPAKYAKNTKRENTIHVGTRFIASGANPTASHILGK